MKLKFTKEETTDFWRIDEDGIDTKRVTFECLGFVFTDELGIHWNIYDDYSRIIELRELLQITDFMKSMEDKRE